MTDSENAYQPPFTAETWLHDGRHIIERLNKKYTEVTRLEHEVERLRADIDRHTGKRRDCAVCGKRTPFPGAKFCSLGCSYESEDAIRKLTGTFRMKAKMRSENLADEIERLRKENDEWRQHATALCELLGLDPESSAVDIHIYVDGLLAEIEQLEEEA